MERHLVRRDPHDSELGEERLAFLAELADERVIRRRPAERLARVAVEVRHHEVDPVLVERVERHALLEDAPELQMEALEASLLRRAVWVAVEHPDAARLEPRRVVLRVGAEVLDHVRVAELRAVVGEDAAEEPAEQVRTCGVPQHVDDARERLRRLRVAQEREREPAAHHEGEQHLPADGADHGVGLRRHYAGVLLEPLLHLRVGPSDAAPGVGLRHGLPVLPAPRPRVGQVVPPRREEPVRDPPVHGAAHVRGEQLRMVRHDRVHGLPLPDGRGERPVHSPYGLVVGMHSGAAVDERARVVRMRGGGDVVALPERTVALLLAAVAHVRRAVQARAAGLDEVGARLEAARRTLPLDVPEPVEGNPPASVEEGA